MPYVWIFVRPKIYQTEPLQQFVNNLPGVIAEALSTSPGTAGELKPWEIEVEVFPFGPMGIHHYDIEILIFANDYPERAENLDDRTKKIADMAPRAVTMSALESLASRFFKPKITIKGFVWPLLTKGAFREFSISYNRYDSR